MNFINQMREAVRDVAKYFPTAIVTGRCRAKVHLQLNTRYLDMIDYDLFFATVLHFIIYINKYIVTCVNK